MSLTTSNIDAAMNGEYTNFSNAVKTELKRKLSNHSSFVKFENDYNKIQRLKSEFNKINIDFE